MNFGYFNKIIPSENSINTQSYEIIHSIGQQLCLNSTNSVLNPNYLKYKCDEKMKNTRPLLSQ